MKNIFTEHLEKQDETYFQHMWSAWKICVILKILLFKCFIHSIFPFLFTTAVSDKIGCLQKITKRGKVADDELYEVFGGD
tara:strand:+ start:245 stop:484 length:240 start_codon:yes stop_codon:yes gene_type:complete